MKITRSDSEKLVIKDFPWAFGLFFLLMGSAAVYYGVRAVIYNSGANKAEGVFAIVGLLFFLGGVVFTQKTVFVFDLERRELAWSRVSLFGWKGGTMNLGRVTGCFVQVLQAPRQADAYRLTLASPDGDMPLTQSYSTGSVAERQRIREAIHTALGLPPPEPELTTDMDGMIRSLIVAGQEISAIKLVREQRGSTIAEAKDYVEALKDRRDSI